MISTNAYRVRNSVEHACTAMRDERRSTMHRLGRPYGATAEGLGNHLMSQTHAQYGNFGVQLTNDFQRYARLRGAARPRRQYHRRWPKRPDGCNSDRIIPDDSRRLAQSLEMPSQVVHEAIVIVDQKQHTDNSA